MLDWIFEGIITWVSSVVTDLMDAVSGMFLQALGTDMTAMEEYFPFVNKAFTVMQYTAWAILFLITVWQLFRIFGGPVTDAENPWSSIGRSALFALLIGYAKPIFSMCLDIATAPYTALMDIQIALESELSEEKQIYIATGLGGKGEKLRFYVLMVSKGRKPFEEYQRNIIEREFGYYFPKVDCEIEELRVDLDYVELLILMPIRSNVQQILTKIIVDCNEYGGFLSDIYTISNVEKFTQAEIEEVLERHESLEAGH